MPFLWKALGLGEGEGTVVFQFEHCSRVLTVSVAVEVGGRVRRMVLVFRTGTVFGSLHRAFAVTFSYHLFAFFFF